MADQKLVEVQVSNHGSSISQHCYVDGGKLVKDFLSCVSSLADLKELPANHSQ